MASKHKRPNEEHPELHPYAPPQHPDVNVPEQQFDATRPSRKKTDRKPHARPK